MTSVCKSMNVQCVWRMLGECRCGRLQKKCVTLSMQIIVCDGIQHVYKSFRNKLLELSKYRSTSSFFVRQKFVSYTYVYASMRDHYVHV